MHNPENNLKVHVLFRCSKRTGKVDTVMTGLGSALMRLWALENTTSSKECFIFVRDTGELVFHIAGNKESNFPTFVKYTTVPTCEDLGISLEDLQNIKDDRFDKED
jgi:hypothetical protein